MKPILKLLIVLLLLLIIHVNGYAKKYELIRYKNHLFIEIMLNDKHCLFIIDTGSSKSIIDISKSKVFNFNYIEFGDQKYMGIGGVSQIYIVYDFKILEFEYDFWGVDIKKMTEHIENEFNTKYPITGIIGADFLCDNKVIINYNNNTIEF